MSSVVDEDTARAIDEGRQKVGGLLTSAQQELRKAFLAFTFTFLGTVLALRWYLWSYLETVTISQMDPSVVEDFDIVARTPFDVILMQIKIGLIVGALVGIIALLYLIRTRVIARLEEVETIEVTIPRLYGFIALSAGLAVTGLTYAYGLFFPLMFKVLAEQAHTAGVKPSYGIVRYTEFMLLLTISFGLAAQLPLFMGALSYAEIVPYETFRDKWRYAVVGIFVFGAVFSPPDPFTQILWAIPLMVLYAFSLGVAKVVTNVHRAGAQGSPIEPGTFKRRGYAVLAVGALATVVTTAAFARGAAGWLNDTVMPAIPAEIALPYLSDIVLPTAVEVGGPLDWIVAGVQVGLVVGGVALGYTLVWILRQPVIPRRYAMGDQDPEDIDLTVLDAAGVDSAPPEAFEHEHIPNEVVVDAASVALETGEDDGEAVDADRVDWGEAVLERYLEAATEDQATDAAGLAMENDRTDVGRAILERFYEVEQERDDEEADADVDEGDARSGAAATAADADDGGESDPFASTAAGVMDALTEENTDEDDIGGYLWDIRFVLDSLRSRMFVIFAVFMGVFGGLFGYLYVWGIEHIIAVFTAQVPNEHFAPGEGQGGTEATDILIALHPVEVLIFIVKFSGIVAILVTLPLVLYYAWPAIVERGFAPGEGGGDRRGFLVWGGGFIGITAVGSVVGFLGIAPYVISWLITDAASSGMVISYRVRSLLWVVFFLTLGIGLFVNIPVGMGLLHSMDLVPFESMYRGWRHVTFGIFVFSWFFSPRGVLTMLLLAVPIAVAYLLGLGILWLLTFPSRMLGESSEPQAG